MKGIDLSLVAKARWNALAAASGSLSRLLAGVAIARLLGPEHNGHFAFLMWLAESLVLLFSVGLPTTLNRFLALKMGRGEEAIVLRILHFSLRAGLVMSLLAVFATYVLALHLMKDSATSDMASALAWLVAVQLWAGLTQAILIGLQHFRAYARIVVLSSLVLVVGQIIGTLGWGLQGAIYGTLASYLVSAALNLRAILQTPLWKRQPTENIFDIARSITPYARDAWLAGLISAVTWGRAELFFLEWFSTAREMGYFAAGMVFSSLLIQAVGLVSGAFLPHLSYLVGEGKKERVGEDYRRMIIFIALPIFPLALGGIALMPDIVPLLFGAAYADATPAAQWLMAAGILAFASAGSAVVYSHGDAHIIRNWSVLGACLLVLLCILLAPVAGAEGVAAARFFVQSFMIGIGFYLLRSRYDMPVPLRPLVMLLAAAASCAVAASLISQLVGGGVAGILCGIACGATVYGLMLRMFNVISAEDAATLANLFARLPSMLGKPAAMLIKLVGPR